MTDRIGIDEQIAYAESWYADNKFNQAILATLRDYKRIMETKVPEPVAWCVVYEGPPTFDKIQSDPTMYKPSAEAIVKNGAPGLSVEPLYTSEVLDLLRWETAKNQKLTLELQSLLSQSMET